ncbi:MAG: T9SS type A sorting domain-containing protein [Candidatus Kariarchaeaceae archaeon]|jgi:hypothetical protein
MKILSLILLLICIILLTTINGDERGLYKEIFCRTKNIQSTDIVYFYLDAIGSVWLHSITPPHYIGTQFNGHSVVHTDTFIVGNYSQSSIGWTNLVGEPSEGPPYMSYGLYKMRIRKNEGDEIHFYLDFRDRDWPLPSYPCGRDIYVYYSGNDSIYIDPGSTCNNVTISEEEVYTLWDLKGKDTINTDYFNNFWQNSLQLIPNNNNNPRLVWARHPTMSDVTNYRVYRAVSDDPVRKPLLLTYTLRATTNSSTFNWTDPDIRILEDNYYFYYYVKAYNGSTESSGSNIVSTPGQFYKPVVKKKISVANNNYKLYQNYPNPFNPTTNISFHLAEESTVQLQIYNIQGKLVSTLVNETRDKGNYSVSFNSDGLPSGVFFYRLTTKNFTDIKRMLLLK